MLPERHWLAYHGNAYPGVFGVRGHGQADGTEQQLCDAAAATAAHHLRRTDGFAHAPDILVGSFYDPALDEGCAFEELISFHGGLGGSQTRPFLLYPAELPVPAEPIVGAEALHRVLAGWRALLEGERALPPTPAVPSRPPKTARKIPPSARLRPPRRPAPDYAFAAAAHFHFP